LTEPSGLAFKAREIEERIAVYIHRPVGILFARAARRLRLTPTAVTVCAGLVGIAGGLLLADRGFALIGFGLLVLHGILDSSDGQLARMTGQTSELGRVLDGVAGYVTHIAIYGGVVAAWMQETRHPAIVVVGIGVVAGVCNIVHAQMYDYYRSSYSRIVVDGLAPPEIARRPARSRLLLRLLAGYEVVQRRLARRHAAVEAAIARRATDGTVSRADRERYRGVFYRLVRGWNLLGDNTRFYAIGVLAWVQHVEWFPAIVLGPMNVVFIVMHARQARADDRFLAVTRTEG
jgi:hypothetical protein